MDDKVRKAFYDSMKPLTREKMDELFKESLADSVERWMIAYVNRKNKQREATRRFRKKQKEKK